MWTISYEFRCYLLVPLLAYVGILQRRRLVLGLTAGLLGVYAVAIALQWRLNWGPLESLPSSVAIFRDPLMTIRFAGLFLAGACFQLYRKDIRFDGRLAAACALVATLLLFVPALAEFGLATFGAYALFWAAFTQRLPFLRHINNDWDISYGVYLYAWPIGAMFAYFMNQIDPLALCLATLAVVTPLAFMSWKVIEEPALKLKRRRAQADGAGPAREASAVIGTAEPAAAASGPATGDNQR
jgi:peptidoglycan/LPS O-acetylase OafA/YrhL